MIRSKKSTGLFAYLVLNLGLDDENAQKIFTLAGEILIGEYSDLQITPEEAGTILDSNVGLNIAVYIAYNFVEGLKPDVFSKKLSIIIPLFRKSITEFAYDLRFKAS